MTRQLLAIALLLSAAACGSGSTGNAAVGKKFDYGAPAAVGSTQLETMQTTISGALALRTASDPSSAQSLSDVSSVTSSLLGDASSVGLALAPSSPQRAALIVARDVPGARFSTMPSDVQFQDPSCMTTTATTLQLQGCTVDIGDTTTQGRITANGGATLVAGKLTWDFTVGLTMSGSGFSAEANAHRQGSIAVTDSTVVAELLGETSGSASGGGRSESLSMSESVQLDVTYSSVDQCVTSGTLEAKRVWTNRPSGAAGPGYADGGALVAWTGCGAATLALSR